MKKYWIIKWIIFSVAAFGLYYLYYWLKPPISHSIYEVPLAFIIGAFYFRTICFSPTWHSEKKKEEIFCWKCGAPLQMTTFDEKVNECEQLKLERDELRRQIDSNQPEGRR